MRVIKDESKHYLETKILGAYETVDLNWQSDLNGNKHRAFEDTEITTTENGLVAERKMIVDGKTFTVCSIFPEMPKATSTDKILKIIKHDLEK